MSHFDYFLKDVVSEDKMQIYPNDQRNRDPDGPGVNPVFMMTASQVCERICFPFLCRFVNIQTHWNEFIYSALKKVLYNKKKQTQNH